MKNNWTDKYLLNIESIDQQHKAFFDLWSTEINNIDKEDGTQMVSIVHKLEDYLKNHIKDEEELMLKAGYKDIEMHIAQHKFFVKKVDNLKQELNFSNPLLFEKITVFMKKWFLHHIIQSDQKYKESVTEYLNKEEL